MTDIDRTPRAYPVPRQTDDPRFTYGLVLDVAGVLREYGFPPVANGDDLLELHRALYRFLYALPADPRPAIRNAKGHHA